MKIPSPKRYTLFLCAAVLLLLTACSGEIAPPVTPDFLLKTPGAQQSFLGHAESTQIITLGNGSNGIMTWKIRDDASWLDIHPSGGAIAPDGFQVITLDIGNMPEGTQAAIEIESNLGTQRLELAIASDSCIEQVTPVQKAVPASTLSSATSGASQEMGALNSARYVPNQLLIRYEDGISAPVASLATSPSQDAQSSASPLSPQSLALHHRYGLEVLESYNDDLPSIVSVTNIANLNLLAQSTTHNADGTDGYDDGLEALAAQLSQRPDIRYAEPNYYLTTQNIPTPNPTMPNLRTQGIGSSQIIQDPIYAEGQMWYLEGFGVREAWDIQTGSQAITLAILDSGFDLSHEEFEGRLVRGCDIEGRDDDLNPSRPMTNANTHGTHVMGIAAALGGNGKGGSGVAAENVRVLPVKIANDAGVGITVLNAVKAILWASGQDLVGFAPNPYPADIMNMSFGGPAVSQPLNDAIARVASKGILVFAASGNSGLRQQIFTPSNAPKAIAVGSVDGTRERSCFSNYNGSISQKSVALVAPGGALGGFSKCNAQGAIGNTVVNTFLDNQYGYLAGTSMATPFVSGAAALVWSQNPFLPASHVRSRLLGSTTRNIAGYNAVEYGVGVLCVDRALGASTLCGQEER